MIERIDTAPFPADVPTASIPSIDYRQLSSGDAGSAQALYDATRCYGFFYLTNHDIDANSIFDLASDVFELPLEEKLRYDMGTTGHYFGYKRSGAFVVDAKGTPDHSQFYNISKNDILGVGEPTSSAHPQVVTDSRAMIREFMVASHDVVETVLKTISTHLGLDADLLSSIHQIGLPSACQTRLTNSPPLESGVISVGEHTDFGSVTVLFNKLGGLQVLSPNSKEWTYVKPQAGAAIINLGDALVKLSGGRLYSGLHRVVGPPGDQAKHERHSIVYFCRPNSNIKLRSLFLEDEESEEDALYSDEWVRERAKSLAAANYKSAQSQKFFTGTAHNADTGPSKVKSAIAAV